MTICRNQCCHLFWLLLLGNLYCSNAFLCTNLPHRGRRPYSPSWSLKSQIKSVTTAGLDTHEVQILQKTVKELSNLTSPTTVRSLPDCAVLGTTGRVVLVSVAGQSDELEDLQFSLLEKWNDYIREGRVRQPFFLSVEFDRDGIKDEDDDDLLLTKFCGIIQDQINFFSLKVPFPSSIFPSKSSDPALHYEVDVREGGDSDSKSIFVFDDLISEDLRQRLFNVVSGYNDDNDTNRWDDTKQGPDPSRWIRGGLVDDIDDTSNKNFGLTTEATEDVCENEHKALTELEVILSSLFPSVTFSRLSQWGMGQDSVTPLTANAAQYGDNYQPHIDANPLTLPPSPWTDIYGRYRNRSRGKPRFMSCLVYIGDWNYQDWGAPTRVWDNNETVDIAPVPGRVVLMDQDVKHSVIAPSPAAGKQPRYSLVWKLIIHPNFNNQDIKNSMEQHLLCNQSGR